MGQLQRWRRTTFAETLDWLIEWDIISEAERDRWSGRRQLRNLASHPDEAAVMPPAEVLRILETSAHDMNRLFAR